MAVERN